MIWSLPLYAGAAALFCVAAFSVYRAFQSPTFVAGLSRIIALQLWKDILPSLKKLFKRKSPEEETLDRAYAKLGKVRPTKLRRHPDEGGNH